MRDGELQMTSQSSFSVIATQKSSLILLSAVSRETGGTKDDVQSRMWHDETVKQQKEEEEEEEGDLERLHVRQMSKNGT